MSKKFLKIILFSFLLVSLSFFYAEPVLSQCGSGQCCLAQVTIDTFSCKIRNAGTSSAQCYTTFISQQHPSCSGSSTCQTAPICSSNDTCRVSSRNAHGFATACSFGSCSPAGCCTSSGCPGPTATPKP